LFAFSFSSFNRNNAGDLYFPFFYNYLNWNFVTLRFSLVHGNGLEATIGPLFDLFTEAELISFFSFITVTPFFVLPSPSLSVFANKG